MRIVAGEFRGRVITPPASFKARPTTDFAKENLFNILANRYDFEGLSFLDLFSGTGSISYEAASRGATRVLSVEMNPSHVSFIRDMVRKFSMSAVVCVSSNVLVFLRSSFVEQFDIVFADPPYDMPEVEQIPDMVLSKGLLADGGVFVFEHSGSYDFSSHPAFEQTRRYGSVNFTFFTK